MAKKPVRTGAQQSWYNLKQILAGAAETTIANTSETKGNYRPAVVDAVPAVAGVIASLINQRKDGKPTDGSNYLEQVINNSTRRAMLGTRRTNETLGISNPANTDETIGRILGGLIVPAPKAAVVARGASAVRGGKKVVDATKKVVAAVPKPIRKTAKVVNEVVMPLRQTGGKVAIPVGAAIGGVVDAALDGTVDPTTGQRYDGSVREALGFADPNGPEAIEEEELTELDSLMMQTATEVGDYTEEDDLKELDSLASGDLDDDEIDMVQREEKLSGYEQAGLAIGAVLGGGAVIKYAGDALRARRAAATIPQDLPQFTGKKNIKSKLSRTGSIVTESFRQTQPVIELAEQHLGKQWAKRWGWKADTAVNVALQSKGKDFFVTGRAPGARLRSVPLAPLAEAYAKELDPTEQKLISDALNAASALDDYRSSGTLAALNTDKMGRAVTPAQLEMLVQTVTSNPRYSKYFDAVQKSYDDLGKFKVARGRDTQANYAAMRRLRPNYVQMNRNLEPDALFTPSANRYSANNDQGLGMTRNLEEGAGVQGATGVGNPFISLFDGWMNEIRRADHNDLRADFLINMDATGALNANGAKIIQKVSPTATSSDDNIHRVRVNGEEQAFLVRDPEVSRSLHFAPRASVKILEALRQTQQSMITGPLATPFNMFAVASSPVFDSMAAGMLKQKGVKLGAANRLFVGGYTGAAKMLRDETYRAMGQTMRDAMIRDHSWLKAKLGDQNLDKLATWFENAYENSTLSQLDQRGISSASMHGSPDTSELMTGMESFAPNFAKSAQQIIRSDIDEAALAGDVSTYQAILKKSGSRFAQLNASRLARTYGHLVTAFHNGARYSAFEASKRSVQDQDFLNSAMRRLSADSAQHGANDIGNIALGSNVYANLGWQTMYELGSRIREAPAKALFNIATPAATAAAMFYAAMAYDDEAREIHLKKTPQQKTTSLTMAGGMELKLDPMTRLVLAPILPILDHMSGLSEGKVAPSFAKIMESWLENDISDEESDKDWDVRVTESVKQNLPIAPDGSSFPLANMGATLMGVDVSASRMSGETMLAREQDLTGMETGNRRPNSLVDAKTELLISSLFATSGRTLLGMADDAYRAANEGAPIREALGMGAERWQQEATKGSGIFKPLFGQYEAVESAADENFLLMKDRDKGIEQAIKVWRKNIKQGDATGKNPFTRLPVEPEANVRKQEVLGTELEYIAGAADQLERMYLSKHRANLSALGDRIEYYNALKRRPLQDRNRKINTDNEARRYERYMMLVNTRDYEEMISQRIGRPFTFDEFNPNDFLNPLPPEPQE